MKTMRDRLIDNILKAQAHLSIVAAGYAQLNDNLCSRLMSTADDEKNRRMAVEKHLRGNFRLYEQLRKLSSPYLPKIYDVLP